MSGIYLHIFNLWIQERYLKATERTFFHKGNVVPAKADHVRIGGVHGWSWGLYVSEDRTYFQKTVSSLGRLASVGRTE